MEELVGARNPHSGYDLLLLHHYLPGPHGAHDDRAVCADQMLPGDHHHRLQRLPLLPPALVQNAELVLPAVCELLLLRRRSPITSSLWCRGRSRCAFSANTIASSPSPCTSQGFCMFVLSLVKKHYRLQFYMFGWTHVTLLIVVTQSHLIIHNLFEGMIWFIVPISCVICNDIMAYMFGFFFGRTPLIKLSPKKTWEGFIGGFFATIVFGILLSYVMSGYRYFVCPVEFNNDSNRFTVDCEPSELFQLQEYVLPSVLESLTGWTTVRMYPFQIHSIALSSFASIMGPFGGFFASGFKRAFKIKDFADTIPGHGGIMDRFDCQYLMATFVNVYIASFIRGPNPSKVIQQLLALRLDQQLHIFNSLKAHLTEKGLLSAIEEAA
ncbi:hypothetical protein ANANG_G00189210 [Anguilla anguilla]|uniref:Phosphatidate cytidylyltransferase n=1 Tax=Anguilla anguilla TaxID=7936 RepID=A0A9D3M488_ANGAN|nr:hypothetical protein ANANG_G00189210 [Anguilla anguilla]